MPDEMGNPVPDTTAQDDALTATGGDADKTPPDQDTEPIASTQEEEQSETAPDEEEEESAETVADKDELDDETIEAIIEAYRDKVLKSKRLQSDIDRIVRSQVDRQVSERIRTSETESESERLVNQGKAAAKNIADLADAAQRELEKATKGEDFDGSVFKPGELVRHLGEYGLAVQSYINSQVDTALQSAWDATFDESEGLPPLSDEQADDLSGLVETFNRMKNDPRQSDKSRPYLLGSLFKFIASRGKEAGAAQERERSEKARSVRDKIAGKNAVAAAKAKLESSRRPPAAPASKPKPAGSGNLMDDYRAAKKAGDTAKAQSIVDQMATEAFR